MKNIMNIILCISFVFLSMSVNADTEVLTDRLKFEVDENGSLKAESNYSTNYVLRGIDRSTGDRKWLGVVSGTSAVIDFDIADVEWDGFFPKDINFKLPTRKTESTTINLSTKDFFDNNQWKNIDLRLTGFGLLDLSSVMRDSDVDGTDVLASFLFNLLSFADASLEVVSNGSKLTSQFNKKKYGWLRKLAEDIADYKNTATRAGMFLTIANISLDQTKLVMNELGIDETSDHYLGVYYRRSLALKEAIEKLKRLGLSVASVKTEDQNRIKGKISERFSKFVDSVGGKITDGILNTAAKETAKLYKNAENDYERVDALAKGLIGPLSESFNLYQAILTDRLDKETSESKKEEIIEDINFLRRGRAIIFIASLIHAENSSNAVSNIWKMAKEDPAKLTNLFSEMAKSVTEEFLKTDNIDTLAKTAYGKYVGNFSSISNKKYYKNINNIGKANVWMKAVALGNTVGNRMIPILWDLLESPGTMLTTIKDGKFNRYGNIKSRLLLEVVDINGVFQKSYELTNPLENRTISLHKGDSVHLIVSLAQEKLFNKDIAPWELNSTYPPRTMYDILISTPSTYKHDFVCVMKFLGYTNFSVYSNEGSNYMFNGDQCGTGTLLGGDWFSNEKILTLDELLQKYKLRSFDTELTNGDKAINDLSNIYYYYDSESIENISVLVTDISQNSFIHNIKLVPAIENLNFTVDSTSVTNEYRTVSFNNSEIKASSQDPIKTQTWDWGDGSVTDFPEGTPFGSTTHSYDLQGVYTVTLTLVTESGAISTVSKEIEVLSSSPLSIFVATKDYDAKVSWNKIHGASEYEICLSKTEILNGVCPSQAIIETTTDTNYEFHTLDAVTTYYLGVKYTIASKQSSMSEVKTFVTGGNDGDFNLVLDSATSTHINLSWEKPTGAASYKVCQSTLDIHYTGAAYCDSLIDGSFWNNVISESLSITTDPENNVLQKDVIYHFRVVAFDNSDKVIAVSSELNAKLGIDIVTGKLNDTGITQCADNSSNNLDCPVSTYPKQDAQTGRDATHNDNSDGHAGFSFTKISSTGSELPASATEWSCVKDNVTGLIWENKTNDGGLHDKNDRYNWYNTDNTSNGGSVGYADNNGDICYGYNASNSASYCNTQAYVARVNAEGWCGATDWRMPTIDELRSIVDYSIAYPGPTIDTDYFPNTLSSVVWSSSPNANYSGGAWNVYFDLGGDGASNKYGSGQVRLVRSGQ